MHCICYIANTGYLFQTLLSATQARAHTSSDQCDVLILDISATYGTENRIIAEVCEQENVKYRWYDARILDGAHVISARLILDRLLPEIYTEILYLDGDIQVVGDLGPVLALQPGAGKIAAVRDIMVFLESLGHPTPDWQANKAQTGTSYVNAGVLRVNRGDWAAIAREARAVMARDASLPFAEQDAINMVMGSNIDHLSVAWNFPGFMLRSGLEHRVAPVIVHFMSNPRPWQGSYLPWGRTWHLPYLALTDRYPALAPYRQRLRPLRYLGYKVKQPVSFVRDSIWRSAPLQHSIMAFEESAIV